MRTSLLLTLFAVASFAPVSASAQDANAMTAAQSACGPAAAQFDAKEDTIRHPIPQPDAGKALVYVVQDLGELQCPSCGLTRVGADGAWVGVNRGSSYFFFSVEPGDHHLCMNWQSRLEWRSRSFSMANFTAEAGHVYYFRSRIFDSRYISYFDLESVNDDQGRFLVASSALSVWEPKKKK